MKIYPYNSARAIPPIGMLTTRFQSNGLSVDAEYTVVQGNDAESLLGKHTAEQLHMLRFGPPPNIARSLNTKLTQELETSDTSVTRNTWSTNIVTRSKTSVSLKISR